MAVTLWVLSSLVLLLNGRDSTVSGHEWVTSDDYQYLINDQRMTWNEGTTFCREKKATAFLVRPTNETTDFLRQFCSGRFVADHRYSENMWRWSDATPIPSDSKWAMNYPMNDKYWTTGLFDCSTGELLNVDPTYVFSIICQAPLDSTTHSPTTPSPTPTCGDPWFEYSGRCYLFTDPGETQPWVTAVHNCSMRGGDLVSIHNLDLLAFLRVKAGKVPFWIGLQNEKDVFVWADGSTTDDIDTIKDYLDKWEECKNCVALNSTTFPKTLEHQDCVHPMAYICSKKANDGSWRIGQY